MKIRKIMALTLAMLIVMAAFLTACGDSSQPQGEAPAASSETQTASSEAPPPGDDGGEEAAAPAGDGLPIVEEPTTLTMWVQMSPQVSEVISDFNENAMFQELERRTGVHIEFTIPPSAEVQQSLNVLIASGNYPDMMHLLPFTQPSYPGGTDKGIADGVIMNVNSLVDEYMPNLKALMEDGDDIKKAVYTDEGNIAGFYNIAPVAQTPWYGLAVRQDWLDDLGLDTPVTYDDWYEMLKAFRDEKGADSPAMLYYKGYHQYNCWTSGYGISVGSGGDAFFHENGVVKHGPSQEGFKEYLTMVKQWYDEGLIDQDFPTRVTDSTAPETHTTTNRTGAWNDMYVNLGSLKDKSSDPNFQAVGVPNPSKTAGETLHFGQHNARVGRNMMVITTNCDQPEVAAKWIDYHYGEEGSILTNYGVEGVSFEYNANGEPEFNEFMMNNPDGLTLVQAMGVYARPPLGGTRYYWQRELAMQAPENLAAPGIWMSNVDFANMIPGHAVLSADEADEYTLIMGDIETYVDEMTLRFILGQESLDSFDAFVDQVKAMNIDRAVELKQASFDRYSAR